MMKGNILITGGDFNNKGAEAMVYVSIYEMKNRFPDFNIIMCNPSYCNIEKDNFLFDIHISHSIQHAYAANGVDFYLIKSLAVMFLRNSIKKCTQKEVVPVELVGFHNLLKDAVAVIDVSGYALGTVWPKQHIKRYTNLIKACKCRNIPIYYLPQSFGPFNYSFKEMKILSKSLKNATLIFAREKEGYNDLIDKFHLQNVELSTDLVLQNKFVNYDFMIKNRNKKNCNIITDKNNVAILPNNKMFNKYDNTYLLSIR